VSQRAPSSGLLSKLSIEYKLPLIIGGLLATAVLAVAIAAYREVRGTSMRLATERLTSVATQFRDLLGQQGNQLRAGAAATASRPSLVQFARTRDPNLRAAVVAEMRAQAPVPQQILADEIRDASGRVLLSSDPLAADLASLSVNDVLPRSEPSDSAVLGVFRLRRDTIVYPIAAPIPGVEGAYFVRWRRFAGTQRSREQMNQLIGTNASLFVGNADGTLWSNLERAVDRGEGPPLTARDADRHSYTRDGEERVAAAAVVRGTPWMVAVEFPRREVLAPVTTFTRRIAVIAALALVLALALGWWMSRRITVPLRELTNASSRIAAGNFDHGTRIDRADELGRLAQSFDSMATEVRQAREGLEQKVDERTRELNAAMTQLREAQEALVQKERLAMLGQLSSGVGHELRNPLGVMMNAVYYLKMVLKDSPESVRDYLDIIQRQVTLSEKIISDLLDFARSKKPQRKPTPLREATDAQIDRLGKNDGVRIDTQIPESIPPALVDPIQFGQIVLNLLTNASQALDGNGRIMIRAAANGSNLIYYDVTDTGPGVASENLDKIFEPLFTTKARGIGLGLSVSRTLARANGGDLTLRSAPGQGATFRLTLPMAESELQG
jgi:signal transduction histidine kinase